MSDPTQASSLAALRKKLTTLRMDAATVEAEIEALESINQLPLQAAKQTEQGPPPSSPSEKIALFLDLFGTRRDVYPHRWDNQKTSRSGYSPACDNGWQRGICLKPQVKCSDCPHQKFPALDAVAIEKHLRGLDTLGVYAITEQNTCRFLAADFDGDGWKENVSAYREAGTKAGLQIAIERSRSGNGAHAWIFFSEQVPAAIARKLGASVWCRAVS